MSRRYVRDEIGRFAEEGSKSARGARRAARRRAFTRRVGSGTPANRRKTLRARVGKVIRTEGERKAHDRWLRKTRGKKARRG